MKKRIIFVMNRWDSSKGGIQTVNRELLLALARSRGDLECIAVVTYAEQAEVNQAFLNGVTLIHGTQVDEWNDVLLSNKFRDIDPNSVIGVVGHSSFSGLQAKLLRNFWFKNACLVQFIHMDPMRTEAVKENKQDRFVAEREQKLRIELEIAAEADVVFCVGPRLHRAVRDLFITHQYDHSRVYRLDCGMAADQKLREETPEQPIVVCLGRTESIRVKGLDIFAYVAGIIDQEWAINPLTKGRHIKPRYIVRGAETNPEALQAKLIALASEFGGNPEIVVRPYTTDKANLNADLRGATAFLMPSREEGFGLVACEAISFGAPIVVSANSGMAELIQEIAQETGMDFGSCVIEMSSDAKEVAKQFANVTLPLLVGRPSDNLLYPRLRGHLSSVCSWETAAAKFIEVVEASHSQNLAEASDTGIPKHVMSAGDTPTENPEGTSSIQAVLAAERESLMMKNGVIAVGVSQAIVVTVEKGTKPNLPAKINGFKVVVREVEEVKLTSTEPSSGHDLLINGKRCATVGLFGIDFSGQLFAITVAHAFVGNFHDFYEIVVEEQRIPVTIERLDERGDWAILRVHSGKNPYDYRYISYRRTGANVFVETPGKLIAGTVDSIDITMDIAVGQHGKRRYEDAFEVALDTGIRAGCSGAVVSDDSGGILGVVVGAVVKHDGSVSVIARDASNILEQHALKPVSLDDISTQPHICLLLESDEVASAFYSKLKYVSRFKRQGRLYFRGRTLSGTRLTFTTLRNLDSVNSSIAMTSMLIDNRPDAVFIVGQCTGLNYNQKPGDVLIASEVLGFESMFAYNATSHFSPNVFVTSMMLQSLGRQLIHDGSLDRVHVGPIASFSSPVSYHNIDSLQAQSRNLAGLVIGAEGAVRAAHMVSSELPVLIVSEISTLLGQYAKNGENVLCHASSVVLEIISHLKINTRTKRRSLFVDKPILAPHLRG
ncbi:glycosyltransferase [Acetobacter estunensis]|uniref:glycosyltransferase n=1 Tax=Acetobacter estunensis TaxID=104097 RepID=UPI001C2D100A|nr:glycosyltransferase [Acetobacter estunensis]MBV1836207.1 glycosyltransferase [Acetobacter estunensis]